MNEFESFVEKIREQFPDAKIDIDPPDTPTGNHWLDVTRNQKCITIEWRPTQGFGFYSDDAGYGEGPQDVITGTDNAFKRIVALLQT